MNCKDYGCELPMTPTRVSHCLACHQTFSSVGVFDKHQGNRGCKDPKRIGLVQNERQVWYTPLDKESPWRK